MTKYINVNILPVKILLQSYQMEDGGAQNFQSVTVLWRHPNLLDSPQLCFCASVLHYDLSAQFSIKMSKLHIWMKQSCRRTELKWEIQDSSLFNDKDDVQ